MRFKSAISQIRKIELDEPYMKLLFLRVQETLDDKRRGHHYSPLNLYLVMDSDVFSRDLYCESCDKTSWPFAESS